MAAERGADDHRLPGVDGVDEPCEQPPVGGHRALDAGALGGEAVAGKVEGVRPVAGRGQRVEVAHPAVGAARPCRGRARPACLRSPTRARGWRRRSPGTGRKSCLVPPLSFIHYMNRLFTTLASGDGRVKTRRGGVATGGGRAGPRAGSAALLRLRAQIARLERDRAHHRAAAADRMAALQDAAAGGLSRRGGGRCALPARPCDPHPRLRRARHARLRRAGEARVAGDRRSLPRCHRHHDARAPLHADRDALRGKRRLPQRQPASRLDEPDRAQRHRLGVPRRARRSGARSAARDDQETPARSLAARGAAVQEGDGGFRDDRIHRERGHFLQRPHYRCDAARRTGGEPPVRHLLQLPQLGARHRQAAPRGGPRAARDGAKACAGAGARWCAHCRGMAGSEEREKARDEDAGDAGPGVRRARSSRAGGGRRRRAVGGRGAAAPPGNRRQLRRRLLPHRPVRRARRAAVAGDRRRAGRRRRRGARVRTRTACTRGSRSATSLRTPASRAPTSSIACCPPTASCGSRRISPRSSPAPASCAG